MATIGYPPEQVGGTEVFVHGLIEALRPRGYHCEVVYLEPFEQPGGPAVELRRREHEGTPVHVIRVNRAWHRLEFIQFDAVARARILEAYERVVETVQPGLVHVHPLVLGFDSYLVERLRQQSRKVVVTFHSSTTSCARGDLVRFGTEVCDGRIRPKRCTACLYHFHGVPRPAAALLARLPRGLYRAAYRSADALGPTGRKLRSFFSIPLLIEAQGKAWARAMGQADAVVAVCRWVRDVILGNGVPADKVMLSRHGLRIDGSRVPQRPPGAAACFGYLGRISPEKGISILLDALASLPQAIPFRFEFCSATLGRSNLRPEEGALVERVRTLATRDSRIRVLDGVANERLAEVLAGWDALVVPSLWFESGPQVVYEAFSVRTPVIGSDRGGIAELVEDGRTGYLVPPGDAGALAAVLRDCALDPGRLRRLRGQIGPVRTTADLADDMEALYARVRGGAAADGPRLACPAGSGVVR